MADDRFAVGLFK